MNKTALLLTTLLSASMFVGCSKDSEEIEDIITAPAVENDAVAEGQLEEENETIINTAPEVSAQNFSVNENAAEGDSVGHVLATDKENDDLKFYLLDFFLVDGNVPFTINQDTGEITVSSGSLDYDKDELYEFEVSVVDGEFSTRAKVIIYIDEVQ